MQHKTQLTIYKISTGIANFHVYTKPSRNLHLTIKKQRRMFLKLEKNLGIRNWEDWYNVSREEINNHFRNEYGFMSAKSDSLAKSVMLVFPEHRWKPWKFEITPSGFWNNPSNQRTFMLDLADNLNIKHWEDWYQIESSQIIDNGGASLLRYYGQIVSECVVNVFPEYNWKKYRFSYRPSEYWLKKENLLEYFEYLRKSLGIQTLDGFYKLQKSNIISKNNGAGIYQAHGSLYAALKTAYPEYDWKPWKFDRRPSLISRDTEDIKDVLNRYAHDIGASKISELYRMACFRDIRKITGYGLLSQYGYLGLMQQFYPNYDWSTLKNWKPSVSKPHQSLFVIARHWFPDVEDIYVNYLHPDLKFSLTEKRIELDLYIPSLSLAFEVQGVQHYTDSEFISMDRSLDYQKKELCKKFGIQLICVPFTWDKTEESLLEIIKKQNSEILTKIKKT